MNGKEVLNENADKFLINKSLSAWTIRILESKRRHSLVLYISVNLLRIFTHYMMKLPFLKVITAVKFPDSG